MFLAAHVQESTTVLQDSTAGPSPRNFFALLLRSSGSAALATPGAAQGLHSGVDKTN